MLALAACLAPASAQVLNTPAPDVRNIPTVVIKPAPATAGVTSCSLTLRAWRALAKKDYDGAIEAADTCAKRFSRIAARQQASLPAFSPKANANSYWALNDVATCLFIKGKALRLQGRNEEAREEFREVITYYRFAQCWDARGWFWKVADAAKDQIDCMDLGIDYADYSSQTLTSRAWKSLTSGEYLAVEAYCDKCIELYAKEAEAMQSALKDFAPRGQELDYWALNDVATCLFIKGKALRRMGRRDEADKVFREVLDKYSFAQCWDPHGWYWKVSEAISEQLFQKAPSKKG